MKALLKLLNSDIDHVAIRSEPKNIIRAKMLGLPGLARAGFPVEKATVRAFHVVRPIVTVWFRFQEYHGTVVVGWNCS